MAATVKLTPAASWTDEDVAAAPFGVTAGDLHGPRLAGRALSLYRRIVEAPLLGATLAAAALKRNGVTHLMRCSVPEAPELSGVPPPPERPDQEDGCAPLAGDAAASPAARVKAALAALAGGAAAADSTAAAKSAADGGDHGRRRRRPTVLDYHSAYTSGAATPSDVADAIVAFLEAEPGAARYLCAFDAAYLRAQAAASTARYAAHRPLSVLDGVPFAVKDAVAAYPFATGSGTAFLGARRGPVADIAREAPAVAALRSLGALCVGKTQMQEFGLLPTGISPRLGLAHNPHRRGRLMGGSSGGSAALVAAGVVPFAIGTDGGGSIRVPAALCGVAGLKPTQGRMSCGSDCSVAVMGPIAGTLGDALLAYAAMACPGGCAESPLMAPPTPSQPLSQPPAPLPPAGPGAKQCLLALGAARTAAEAQAETEAAVAAVKAAAAAPRPEANMAEDAASRPPLMLPRQVFAGGKGAAKSRPLAGLRVGVFDEWFETADAGVKAPCRAALALLEALGAAIVPVRLPELEALRVAANVAILSETGAAYRGVANDPSQRAQLHDDSRVVLGLAARLSAAHYLQAARVRRRARHHWRRAFAACDVIATPATACVAPRLGRGAETAGELHLPTTAALIAFTSAANFLGLPALALPVGAAAPADEGEGEGGALPPLPVALQLIGQPWRDASLMRAGLLLEAALAEAGMGAPLPELLMPDPLAAGPAAAAAAKRS